MFQRLKPYALPLVIVGLTVLRLVAAARAELVPDEAYYTLWAHHPALGYYDHPPMVAWWITLMPAINLSPLFVRLPFVLSFLPLCWLVYDAGKVLFDEAVARRAVVWLNACLLLSIGCVIATPDPPSVLMWAGGLWALARLTSSQKGWWWLVFGVFAGLGIEAKYTNFFLGLGVVAWMIADTPARRWLATPWPYLGAIVAAAFMAPNLMWNAEHHWITVAKQFGRVGIDRFTEQYLVEFLLTQPLLLNPLIAVFVGLAVPAVVRTPDGRLRMLVALPVPLLAYLLVHVFHDRIQGNWPAPVYPGLVLLAAAIADGVTGNRLKRVRDWAAPVGIAMTAGVLLFLAFAPALPGMAGLGNGWTDLTRGVYSRADHAGTSWIATTDYDTDAELRYYGPKVSLDTYEINPVAERERYAWLKANPGFIGVRALIVVAPNHHPDLSACFDTVRDEGIVSRGKPGKKADFHLYSGMLRTPECDMKQGS